MLRFFVLTRTYFFNIAYRAVIFLLAGSCCAYAQTSETEWAQLDEGIESAKFSLVDAAGESVPGTLQVLRFDPEKVDFELLMASEKQVPAMSLRKWAETYGLVAATNASMYLPDGMTSTGYMRNGAYANNGRIVKNFSAFFVANPKTQGLPRAAVLDRTVDTNWEELLPQYDIVVQNYRLMNAEGKPLWDETAPPYSIAAVAQDKQGRILFLHVAQPLTAYAFAEALAALPLELSRLMYVEGGSQAAMLVNTAELSGVWQGRYGQFIEGGNSSPLPNVLGVKNRAKKLEPEKQEVKNLAVTTPQLKNPEVTGQEIKNPEVKNLDSQKAAPEQAAPEQATPAQAGPEKLVPEQTAPAQPVSEKLAPEQATPEQAAPESPKF